MPQSTSTAATQNWHCADVEACNAGVVAPDLLDRVPLRGRAISPWQTDALDAWAFGIRFG